ncbi:MAG: PD40 domain-containing protein, partial [Acidobacteria bacterium]|nr:PD40 domain-containing protein [Acidobacteriota bacterium]
MTVTSSSFAQTPPPGGAHPPWTVADLIGAQTTNGWQVSRDGRWAVWLVSEVRKVGEDEKKISNLWLGDLVRGESFALTRGNDTIAAPAFSPDGRQVAFLSDRELPQTGGDSKVAKRQLWVLPLRGGEAFPVTRFERDVRDFGWRSDAELVVTAQEGAGAWERERKDLGDTSVVVDDYEHEPPVRLFRVGIDGTSQRLGHNRDWIDTLSVSPDGKRAVVRAQQSLSYDFDQATPPKLFLVDLATGAPEEVLGGSGLVAEDPRWQPDAKAFYFVNQRTRHPKYREATVNDLYRYDLASGRAERVDLGWDRGLGASYLPVADGFLALLSDGVRPRAARYTRTGGGWRRADLEGAHVRHVDGWSASADGTRVAYFTSTANTPPQGYTARLTGARLSDVVKLTDLNPGFAAKDAGRVDVITWPGAGGDAVEGLLHYPLGWHAGQAPAPLVVDIHGGPAAADRDAWDERWSGPLLLWRQRGA